MTNKTQNDLLTAREDRDHQIQHAKRQADKEFVEKVYKIKERDGVTKTDAVLGTGMSRQAFWVIEQGLNKSDGTPAVDETDSS